MAKQTEEIVVKLNVDTKGIDEFDQKSKESEATTKSWTASFGALVGTITAGGIYLLKFNSIIGALNFPITNLIKKFSLFNITFGSLTKTITAMIPQWIKLRAAMIASGIGALVIAVVALVTALKNTVTGTDLLATAWRALGNIVQGVVDLFTGLGKALVGLFTGDWELATEGLAQAWDGVANGIGNAWDNASAYVVVQRQIIRFNAVIAGQNAERTLALDKLNKALNDTGKEYSQNIARIQEIWKLERLLISAQETALALEIARLKTKQIGSTLSEDEIKALNEAEAALRLIEIQRDDADIKRKEALEANVEQYLIYLEELWMADADRAVEQDDLRREEFQKTQTQYNDLAQLYREFLDDQTRADIEAAEQRRINLGVVFEDEEEAMDENYEKDLKTQKKNIKEKQTQEKNFEDFKVSAAQEGFAALQGLAGENQVARGAFMIAEAVANTALAISRSVAEFGLVGSAVAIPIIAAIGAAQIATIAAQMGSGNEASSVSSGASIPGGFVRPELGPVESASSGFFNISQPPPAQTVLVTEDLNAVQNRVAVTENRASIGQSRN